MFITFLVFVSKYLTKKQLSGGSVYFGLHFEGIQSIMAGRHGGGTGSWPHLL